MKSLSSAKSTSSQDSEPTEIEQLVSNLCAKYNWEPKNVQPYHQKGHDYLCVIFEPSINPADFIDIMKKALSRTGTNPTFRFEPYVVPESKNEAGKLNIHLNTPRYVVAMGLSIRDAHKFEKMVNAELRQVNHLFEQGVRALEDRIAKR